MDAHRHNGGFTLIEMIIVVAIIALLATLMITGASMLDRQGKEKALENLFGQIEAALDAYHDFHDSFPPSTAATPEERSEVLYAALSKVVDARKVLEQIDRSLIANKYADTSTGPEIYDPWGTVVDYRYTTELQYPTLTSAGPDKKFGYGTTDEDKLYRADNIVNK